MACNRFFRSFFRSFFFLFVADVTFWGSGGKRFRRRRAPCRATIPTRGGVSGLGLFGCGDGSEGGGGGGMVVVMVVAGVTPAVVVTAAAVAAVALVVAVAVYAEAWAPRSEVLSVMTKVHADVK